MVRNDRFQVLAVRLAELLPAASTVEILKLADEFASLFRDKPTPAPKPRKKLVSELHGVGRNVESA